MLSLKSGEELHELSVDMLVMTAGLTPRTSNIGLEKIGVQLDGKGYIKTSDNLETSVDNIFALGDVSVCGPKVCKTLFINIGHKSVD